MKTLSLLLKPASSRCNLRCRYCFYAEVADSRRVGNYGAMGLEVLETVVRKALAETTELCVFGFQGGEPTLAGLDFYRALIGFEKKYNVNGAGIGHSLQTNGLLLDDAWAGFLRENGFLVGLSLDPGRGVHDDLRRDAAGGGTSRQVLAAARLLSERGVEYNILSVLTRFTAAHPDRTYRFYRQNGFRHLQLIPCLDSLEERREPGDYSLDVGTYGGFLRRFFDLWHRDFAAGDYVSVRMFDNYVHMLAGHPPENCGMAGVCNAYPVVEADGSVYPCDFYAVDGFRLGRVQDESFSALLGGEPARRFSAPSLEPHPACRSCEYFLLCRGGCRRDREPALDGRLSLNRHCEAYRAFFRHALPRLRELAERLFPRAGKPPPGF
ncbi:MAG: anaerobic sulfatase maturase [Planctomycetota bacterium]|jgi:uncharacterized protein|nr:anaerobic sulfatase maturase [Planctomycetota bacterium]